MDEKKYIIHRKKYLKEYKKLILMRLRINSEIRKLRRELNAWDNALIEDYR